MMTLLLCVIYLSFICLGLPDALLGAAWPGISTALSLPVSGAGVLSLLITGGTVLSSLMSGRLQRKLGVGRLTFCCVLLTAGALTGFSFAPGLPALLLLAIPLGLGAGSVDAALSNFVAQHFAARHTSWLSAFWGLGAAAGPVILSFYLSGAGGWRRGYLTIGRIQGGLCLVLLLSLPLWRRLEGTEAAQEQTTAPKLSALLALPGVPGALSGFFCYSAVEYTAGLWGGSFLVLCRGLAPETAARELSLFYIGMTVGRFITGFLTLRFSSTRLIHVGCGLLALGAVLLLTPYLWLLPVAWTILGLGCAPIYPCMLRRTPERFAPAVSQELMGVQIASSYLGAALTPLLVGVLPIGGVPVYLLGIVGVLGWTQREAVRQS